MNRNAEYPLLQIDTRKIYEDAKIIVEKCKEHGVSISGVIKGFNGINCIVEEFLRAGCNQIASSRSEQLVELRKAGLKTTTMLIRIPMMREIDNLVKYIDISLNSEWETIELIEEACCKHNKQHGVVLMLDLGDLREGFFNEKELIRLALHIEHNLSHVKLMGIGTNLGCYGSVKPTAENLGSLCGVADEINTAIGRKLEIVSGGATTPLPLLFEGKMPAGINHLRIGEAILLNRDLPDLWNVHIPGMHQDTFVLKAQIIEMKEKPSYPIGELYVDAFLEKQVYEDRGIRKRALLAVGKQDFVYHDKLIPSEEGIEIIGSSSDHLIIDIEGCKRKLKLGDIIEFNLSYPPMLYLCSSEWVKKVYQFE